MSGTLLADDDRAAFVHSLGVEAECDGAGGRLDGGVELGGRLDDAFSGAVTLCDAGLSGIVGMREPLGGGLRDPLRGTCESQSSIFVSCRSNKALNRSCRSRFLTWQVGWRQLRLTQSLNMPALPRRLT